MPPTEAIRDALGLGVLLPAVVAALILPLAAARRWDSDNSYQLGPVADPANDETSFTGRIQLSG